VVIDWLVNGSVRPEVMTPTVQVLKDKKAREDYDSAERAAYSKLQSNFACNDVHEAIAPIVQLLDDFAKKIPFDRTWGHLTGLRELGYDVDGWLERHFREIAASVSQTARIYYLQLLPPGRARALMENLQSPLPPKELDVVIKSMAERDSW